MLLVTLLLLCAQALGKRHGVPMAADELSVLARKYRTDKVWHNYTSLYHSLFGDMRLHVTRFLEVGVFYGASLRMWHEYFPSAVVHGVDLFQVLPGPSAMKFNPKSFWNKWHRGQLDKRFVLHKMNQSDVRQMQNLTSHLLRDGPQFDIVVEDGSHRQRDQQMNLALLLRIVRPGGYYIIEDTHSGLDPGYDERPGSEDTTLRMLDSARQTGKYRSKFLTPAESTFLETWIEQATVFVTRRNHDSTCVVRKRLRPRSSSGSTSTQRQYTIHRETVHRY